MSKQIVFAYSIAGFAVAVAIVAVAASTLGFTTDATEAAQPVLLAGGAMDALAPEASSQAAAPSGRGGIEYVYVDEPGQQPGNDDAHEDDDDHERHDDGHERGGILSWLRRSGNNHDRD